MAEAENLLRKLVPGDKEFAVTAVQVTPTATKFSTQLSSYSASRKGLFAYNNSDAASGEVYWGNSAVTPSTGMPIPVGSVVTIPVSTDLDVYFVSETGELGDLRILEIA